MSISRVSQLGSLGLEVRERPFHSQRAIGGFTTGDLGMGHIVVNVDDYEKSLAFYRDGLGLRLSDYIEIEMGLWRTCD